MEEKVISNNDEIEIDLGQLVGALVKRAWLISLVSIVCAVVMFFGTYFFVTPTYKASVKLYVNNSALSSVSDIVMDSISSSDISAARGLVKTYIVILNTRETLNDVIDYAGLNLTYSQVKSMLSAASVDSTEVFQVTVTSTDPQEAEKLANAIAYILPNRIKTSATAAAIKAATPSTNRWMFIVLCRFILFQPVRADQSSPTAGASATCGDSGHWSRCPRRGHYPSLHPRGHWPSSSTPRFPAYCRPAAMPYGVQLHRGQSRPYHTPRH